MRKDYVLLSLNQDVPSFLQPKRSIWRSWKQLSRLQRNLMSLLLVTIIMCLLYLITSHRVYKDLQFRIDTADNILIPERKVLVSEPVLSHIKIENMKNSIMSDSKQLKKPAIARVKAPIVEEAKPIDGAALEQPGEAEIVLPTSRPSGPQPVVFPGGGNDRQMAVIGSFRHAWACYKQYAWGHDHLKPISRGHHDWFGLGLTIIDSLDTIYIMGLKPEFEEARKWVNSDLDLNRFSDVNLFEVTIRVLGGLLSTYHLSADPLFLNKAVDVGERLMPCFTRSPSPIPYSDVNLASHTAHSPRWGPDSSTSEVTTIQLEFRDLARAAKDNKFELAASKVSEHVHSLPKKDGLVPVFINPRTGQFQQYSDIKLGARGDSYYEYLLKQWIQTGKTINYLRDDYLEAVSGIESHLVRETPKKKLLYIGELKGGSRDFIPKMDHLVCYLPGTLALGYHHGLPKSHLELAERLIQTCYATYTERPTHLAPEISYFALMEEEGKEDIYVNSNDAHNLLRPETIESLWYLYQITGNTTYQDWGWNIYLAFEKYTRLECGYTSIGNVNNPEDTKPRDMMESFFLGETLKYFYLLFSDDRQLINVDKYVVNTEAHPLPVYKS